jgi:hypothetical protein
MDESINKLPKQSISFQFDGNDTKKRILYIKNDTGYFTKTKRNEVENVLNDLMKMNTSDAMNHLVTIIYKLLSQSTVESRNDIFDLILWAIDNMLSIEDFKLITNIYFDGLNKDLSNIWTFLRNLQECIIDKDVKVIENCRFQIHNGSVLLIVRISKDILPGGMLQFKDDQIPMLSYFRIKEDRIIFGYYEVSAVFESTMKEKIDKILDIKIDTGYFTKTKRNEVENVLNDLMNTSSNMNHLVIIIYKLLIQSTVESRNDIFDLILWAIDNRFSKQVDDINEYFHGFQSMSITNSQESRNTSIKEITSLLSVFSITEKDTGSIVSQSNSGDIQSTDIIKEVIPKRAFYSKLTIGYTLDDIRAYRRYLQECIDNPKTLKCIKSFEFYNDKDGKPHISLSINNLSEEAHLDSEVEADKKLVKDMLSEFGMTEEDILIDFELSSDDFYPAMMETDKTIDDKVTDDNLIDNKVTDEETVNVAAVLSMNTCLLV